MEWFSSVTCEKLQSRAVRGWIGSMHNGAWHHLAFFILFKEARSNMMRQRALTPSKVWRRKSNTRWMLTSKQGQQDPGMPQMGQILSPLRTSDCHPWPAVGQTPDETGEAAKARCTEPEPQCSRTPCSSAPLTTRDASQAANILMDHHWWWSSCDIWQVPHYQPRRNGNHCKSHVV